MSDTTVYIGLGSNLGNPEAQLNAAVQALAVLPQSRMLARSSLYHSAPMGPQDQPDYLNAVVQLQTSLDPEALLDALQTIEASQGRVRSQHWGPRTLDLDILLYGDAIIDSERLKVPHPGLSERNFVLYPLAEIDPQLQVPGCGSLDRLLDACSGEGLERLQTALPL